MIKRVMKSERAAASDKRADKYRRSLKPILQRLNRTEIPLGRLVLKLDWKTGRPLTDREQDLDNDLHHSDDDMPDDEEEDSEEGDDEDKEKEGDSAGDGDTSSEEDEDSEGAAGDGTDSDAEGEEDN